MQPREGMPTRLQHPQVGDLTVGGAAGQLLVIYHAQPGASSADKLALLASLASPTATITRTVPQPDSGQLTRIGMVPLTPLTVAVMVAAPCQLP